MVLRRNTVLQNSIAKMVLFGIFEYFDYYISEQSEVYGVEPDFQFTAISFEHHIMQQFKIKAH